MLRTTFERKNRQLTQEALGVVARIPQPLISLIERGRYQPTPAQLQRLAAVFDVAPDELLKDVAVLGSRR